MKRSAFLFGLALPLAAAVGVVEQRGHTVPMQLVLRDEANQPVVLGSLLDKPALVTFNYFRCAGICSPQLNGIADALNRMGAEPGRDFRIITVSFDPRDTPAIASRKRDNYLLQVSHPMPPGTWRFITGDAATTRALTDAVGFEFQTQGEDYVHPAVMVALSPQGRVTKYIYGVTYLPAELQQAAQEAALGQEKPSIAKLRNICFRYDPAQNRQVFSLTRSCGALLLVGALAFLGVLLVKSRRRKGA